MIYTDGASLDFRFAATVSSPTTVSVLIGKRHRAIFGVPKNLQLRSLLK